MAGYYNTQGIQGTAGNLYGTGRVNSDVFKGNDLFGTDYYNTQDDGRIGYQRFAETLGGNNQFKGYVQSKYPEMWNSFGAASGDDPTLTWTDFLMGNQDKMATDFSNLTPTARGESPGRTLGKLRWL